MWKHCILIYLSFSPNKVAGKEVLGNPELHLDFQHFAKIFISIL